MPKLPSGKIREFQRKVLDFARAHGRAMPWRPPEVALRKNGTLDPYRILISEIMLQQTQVSRVVPKYASFVRQFPNFRALAKAPTRDVLAAWSGLGYNRRALNLKRLAEIVMREHRRKLPHEPEKLKKLPGIGPGTAGSLAVFAFNKPATFIETNIRRVFIHEFFRDRRAVHDRDILPLVEQTLDRKDPRRWYYALMDYGSMLGEKLPKNANPNRKSEHYAKQSTFKGSVRELRGRIVKLVLERGALSERTIQKMVGDERASSVIRALVGERFLARRGGNLRLVD